MSVQLEHVGKKLVVKTPPSRLLSEVLNEFCVKYDMKPEEYGIQHNKKLIDLSLTFRLSGLPQNCKLEVVRRAKAAGSLPWFLFASLIPPIGKSSGIWMSGFFFPCFGLIFFFVCGWPLLICCFPYKVEQMAV
jgi:hypothetical protein